MMRQRLVSAVCVMAAVMAACQQTGKLEKAGVEEAAGPATKPASTPAAVEARLLDEPTRRVVKLTNGMTVLLQQNRTAPAVAARIYVRAGSLTEQQYMGAGISHVLEHLVAGASSGKRGQAENTLMLQEIGNDSNAYTDDDHTCYFITTTSDKWKVAVDLLVDWTTNTNFTKEQFEREFKVVQREIEMGEAEADRTFYKHTLATRYITHPARHPVIGYKPAFQQLTFEDCRSYFQQMYVPDNLVVSMAGDFDLDEAEKFIVGQVAGVRRQVVPSIALPKEVGVSAARRSVARADVKQARVQWALPTTDLFSEDLYPMDVLAGVLGKGESSLLARKVRDEAGLVSSVDALNFTPSYGQGQLAVDVTAEPGKILEAEKAVLGVLKEVAEKGVPAEAVERSKALAAAGLVFGNQTAEQQASQNGTDYLATGSIDFNALYVKRLQEVTPEQVQAAAKKYVKPERLLTTVVLPLGAEDPYRAAAKEGAVTAARGATQKIVLRNGLTLLVTKNPAAPLVTFQWYTLGGLLAENDGNNGIGATMMEMLTRGTEARPHQEIADFIDATGTAVATESGSNSFALSMTALKGKAPEVAKLFVEMATKPKFDGKELEQVRPQLVAAAQQVTEDWYGEAYKHTKEAFYAESPYRRMPAGKAEVIQKLTAEEVRKHHEQFFLNPKGTVVAIAGDLEPAAVTGWVQALEGIPAREVALNRTSVAAKAPAAAVTFATEKGSAAVMFAFGPGMTADDPDRYAMELLHTYLAGYSSASGSVLYETLRGEGLVYDVQGTSAAGAAKGMFLIYALGEPQNKEKIVRHVRAIVEKARAGEIPEAALKTAMEQAINGEKLSKQTIAERAGDEALNELLGIGYDADEHFAERIRKVTKADVVRAAKKYLADPVVVITSPDVKK